MVDTSQNPQPATLLQPNQFVEPQPANQVPSQYATAQAQPAELYQADIASENVAQNPVYQASYNQNPTATQAPQNQPLPQNFGIPPEYRPQPEELVLEWLAPSRPYRKRNRQYYTTIGIIVFLVSLILLFAGQFLPIAVVVAVAFLAYVLNAVPPETILNQITTFGVRTNQNLYYWDEMTRFWFDTKAKQRILHIEISKFPNHLTLLLADQNEDNLTAILSQMLIQEQPIKTTIEKMAERLQELIPLDTES